VENSCFIAEARIRKTNVFANDFVCVRNVLLLKAWCVQKGYFWYVSFNYPRLKSDSLLPTTSSNGDAHQLKALLSGVTFLAL